MDIEKMVLDSKILIVDDERTHLVLVERALKHGGFSAIKSTLDPREVCDIYKSFLPDLILLDIMMPHMDGFQVMDQLKELDNLKGFRDGTLPILVMTARTDPETCFLSYNAGARDFLEKPISVPVVLSRVRNLLESSYREEAVEALNRDNDNLRKEIEALKAENLSLKAKLG